MIRFAALALLALPTLPAQAQRLLDAAPVAVFDEATIESIDYGLVCPAGQTTELPAPGTHLGVIKQREGWQKIEYTTQVIPMVEGIGFGVSAAPFDDIIGVEITITHPPYPGTTVTDENWITDVVRGSSNLNFFTFEFPFERVPGTWAIQASYRGDVLYAVEFDVVDPSRFPNIEGLCQGPAAIS